MYSKYFITLIIILSIFIVLAIIVSPMTSLDINPLIDIDKKLYLKINNSHLLSLNQFMIYLTQYGREVFWILVIFLLFSFGKKSGKKTAIVMSISMIVLLPIGMAAKEIIERPRPMIPESDFLIDADSEFAFPSGHALTVSAGAFIALLLYRDSTRKLTISILLTIEAGLVCFSRVYVGVHYPLDVVGGILLGGGVSLIFVWKEKYLKESYYKLITILNQK